VDEWSPKYSVNERKISYYLDL